eukprot:TRINITY_DN53_c2_g1_i1.p1 TRINITY_DN53_c2_g1~~TRINITY_DN53_c2_g1_i1.p1  ORF type:complete len:1119 (-),score=215.85 TRINITY_DN53_c2_g1_i1:24-3173(-)
MKEYLVRLIYCEMLGHTAEFGYIHAVKAMPAFTLLEKRVGYLAVSLCIKQDDELMMLVVAQLQKDLASSNYLEVCIALTGSCKVLNAELIPCVIQKVQSLLGHQNPVVRKKAVMAIHAFYKVDPNSIGTDFKIYRNCLCDRDPSVMGASLHLLYDLAVADPEGHKDLVPSFVNILKQITEHRLSREYDYHRIPAPWLQIKLLKLLSVLCVDDEELSSKCYEVLLEAMKRADTGLNIGHAVIYECCKTITCIYPNSQLIEAAADAISKFITSPNANLKYLGITSLSSIVRIDAKHATQHQMIVIECLEDSDETIRRKTLDLLYAMTNRNNVEVIVSRLIKFLGQAHDNYLKADLVGRITDLADKFKGSSQWYVDTINHVVALGARHVRDEILQGVLKLIAEGSGVDDDADERFRQHCVYRYYDILTSEKPQPDAMYRLIAWVLGEYSFLCPDKPNKEVIDRLCDLLEKQFEDNETKGWILMALTKLSAQRAADSSLQGQMQDVIDKFAANRSTDLQQRSHELRVLLQHPDLFKLCLPLDGCCEDLEVDADLSFMDGLVQDCIRKGYKTYQNKKSELAPVETTKTLKTEAYETPDELRNTGAEESGGIETLETLPEEELKLHEPKVGRWTASGYVKDPEPTLDVPAETENYAATFNQTETRDDDDEEEEEEEEEVKKEKKKKKKTEKERLAMELFEPEKKKLTKEEKAAKRAEKEAKRAAKEAKKLQKSGALPETTAQASSDLLFNTPRSGPAPGHTPAPVAAPKPADDLDDLLGFGPAPVATQPRVPPAPAAPATPTPAPAARAAAANALDDLFGTGPSAPVTAKLGTGRPVAGTDGTLLVEFEKTCTDDGITIALIVSVSAATASISLSLQTPSKFALTLQPSAGAQVQPGNTFFFPQLQPGRPVTVEARLRVQELTAIGSKLPGQATYAGGLPLLLAVPINPTDLLRPAGPSTQQEFGALWVTTLGECKAGVRSRCADANAVVSALAQANLKLVQVINKEAILVAVVSGIGKPVLVHTQAAAVINLTVRSVEKTFSEALLRQLSTLLQ